MTMVTIMTIFLQTFRGKEGVFDVRTRPWGEGWCIEAATSTRPLRLAQREIGQAPLSSSWRSLASPRDAFLDDEGPRDLLSALIICSIAFAAKRHAEECSQRVGHTQLMCDNDRPPLTCIKAPFRK